MSIICESFIMDQSLVSIPDEPFYPDETTYVPASTEKPSCIGYTGKTAQHYNKNYKTMPADF